MAIEFLAEGAVTLAAAAWTGSGFADNATLVINKPFGNGSPLTTGTDQSGLTVGIDYLDVMKGAVGQLGTGALPLTVDADSAAGDRITNHGAVKLYLDAGGGSATINNFDCGAGSQNYLVGGTFGQTTVQGGLFNANESTVLTNLDGYGGQGEVAYKSDKITLCRIMRGTWVIRRACTHLIIGDQARVIFDPDDAASHTSTAITNYGGHLDWRAGAVPTVNSIGGTIDFSQARAVFAPGATAFNLGGTRIIEGAGQVDTSNVAYVGGMQRSVGGAIPTT